MTASGSSPSSEVPVETDVAPEAVLETPDPDVGRVEDPEASTEDVQEQRTGLLDDPVPAEAALPDEASEADVAEQRLEVSLDEDEGREH